MLDFGAQSHGVWSRCLRFAGEVTRPPRKTRFRLLARLCRTGLVTRRVSMKGFTLEAIPLSRTSWRNVRSCFDRDRSRVEEWRGGEMLRFHSPLVEPDRQISRIRLSDKALHPSTHVGWRAEGMS
jgi:hypothetical protein